MIRFSTFRWVPPFAQGLVRELRVRWALEEVGLPYEQRIIGREDQRTAEYRRLQPFGQVPAFEEDGLVMFESGAIVMHLAERSETLMPTDKVGRERTKSWMFAALNSLEPRIVELANIDLFNKDEEWAKQRRPGAEAAAVKRLTDLSNWLDGRDYLEGRFTAGDLLMTSVLRILRHTDIVARMPVLDAYKKRCEARPAFQKALADHMALFADGPPAKG
jgi:glutathione S-transferase